MTTVEYAVTGMTCAHCENSVRTGVAELPGVTAVDVSAADGRLSVTTDTDLSDADVIAAVDEAGYTAVRK